MALLSYDTDDKTDERLNPAEQARFDQIQAGNAESELSDREKAVGLMTPANP